MCPMQRGTHLCTDAEQLQTYTSLQHKLNVQALSAVKATCLMSACCYCMILSINLGCGVLCCLCLWPTSCSLQRRTSVACTDYGRPRVSGAHDATVHNLGYNCAFTVFPVPFVSVRIHMTYCMCFNWSVEIVSLCGL